MKKIIGVILGCTVILASSYGFAYCHNCNSDYYYKETDYISSCECTDPNCGPKAYNNCISECKCCEAFGNIGAR